VDLQGGVKDSKIILTDIEFTDTLQKLDWNPSTLLKTFETMLATYKL